MNDDDGLGDEEAQFYYVGNDLYHRDLQALERQERERWSRFVDAVAAQARRKRGWRQQENGYRSTTATGDTVPGCEPSSEDPITLEPFQRGDTVFQQPPAGECLKSRTVDMLRSSDQTWPFYGQGTLPLPYVGQPDDFAKDVYAVKIRCLNKFKRFCNGIDSITPRNPNLRNSTLGSDYFDRLLKKMYHRLHDKIAATADKILSDRQQEIDRAVHLPPRVPPELGPVTLPLMFAIGNAVREILQDGVSEVNRFEGEGGPDMVITHKVYGDSPAALKFLKDSERLIAKHFPFMDPNFESVIQSTDGFNRRAATLYVGDSFADLAC